MNSDDIRRQRDLLIRTVYGEAGGEGPAGQAAVAHVIKNRLNSGHWGVTPEDVVMASDPKSGVHQFSMWNAGNKAGINANKLDANSPTYQGIGNIVDGVMTGSISDPTNGATHYYAPRGMPGGRAPSWAIDGTNVNRVGNQIFMNLPGPADSVEARSRKYASWPTPPTSSATPGVSLASAAPSQEEAPLPRPAIPSLSPPGMLGGNVSIGDIASLLKRRDLYGS